MGSECEQIEGERKSHMGAFKVQQTVNQILKKNKDNYNGADVF